ncbi:hypothetical protein [Paracoccus yeei]|uniref:hypothetical protein n=1 Tax=Paracoccus yeei TaxID=147645 RepID=UPI00174E3E33|nr:hypothetical protein [Paracoccus yeei]
MTGLNDLLGSAPEKRRRGRPTREEAAARAAAEADTLKPLPHFLEFRKPVGITFLASVCGKQPKQIAKRLEKCPIKKYTFHQGKQIPLYDFLEAMAYLIPPKGSIEDWFAQQNAASLPPYVNKMWWDSAHQRNRVMLSSNDLWHSDDVMLVLGRVAMAIRQEAKMWVEDLPERELLSDKQYGALVDAVNRMVEDIRKALIEMPRETLSMTAHITSELEAGKTIPDDNARPDDPEEA